MAQGVEHGHEHHVRALNTIRKSGSIARAVDEGVVTSGIMHALVTHEKRFVLVGSVRDDGPLPDVYTDVIEGQRAMRAELADVGYCLMMATQLHSVATGNILPATVPLVCVDINPSTVTKIADRGSNQGRGIVTDVGLFLEQLALELVPDYRRLLSRADQQRRADHPGPGPELRRDEVGDPTRCAAPTSVHVQRGPGRLEQPVAGGRHPSADDHHLGVERRDEVGRADAEPVADRREGLRGRRGRPPRPPTVTIGPVTRSGRRRSISASTDGCSAMSSGRCAPARCPRSTAPSTRVGRTRRPARPARPACARTRRPCRWRRAGPDRRAATAPPMPVPIVIIRAERAPAGGPWCASARAAQLASLSSTTGQPSRSSSRSRSGSPCHGRWGANITRSPARSTKPAAATPTPASGRRRRTRGSPRPSRPRPARVTTAPTRASYAARCDEHRAALVDDPGQHLGAADVDADDHSPRSCAHPRACRRMGRLDHSV